MQHSLKNFKKINVINKHINCTVAYFCLIMIIPNTKHAYLKKCILRARRTLRPVSRPLLHIAVAFEYYAYSMTLLLVEGLSVLSEGSRISDIAYGDNHH